MKRITRHMDVLITRLSDVLTNYDCVSQTDIAVAGGFRDVGEVAQVLAWVRHPDIANHYGWTVPHVTRGRPQPGLINRYIVVGLHGTTLSAQDTKLVTQGALSTTRTIASSTRNEANALRMTRPMVSDAKFKKWAKDAATILDGISAQAGLETQRLETMLNGAKP